MPMVAALPRTMSSPLVGIVGLPSGASAEGQFGLALMTLWGRGVARQDEVDAYMWLRLAAAQGYEAAGSVVGDLAQDMAPDQVVEAERRAAAWTVPGPDQ